MKTILVDAMHAFVIMNEGIYEPMHKLLETYENKKIILTNADDEQLIKFGLNKMPYEVFTLKRNPPKTDSEYYKKLLKHFDLDVSDVIYFEHDENAVKSAQSAGIKSYFYDNDVKDLVALKKFLDENV